MATVSSGGTDSLKDVVYTIQGQAGAAPILVALDGSSGGPAANVNVTNASLDTNATIVGQSAPLEVNATVVGVPNVNIDSQTAPLNTNATLVGTPSVTIDGQTGPLLTNATLVGTPGVAATVVGVPDVNILSQTSNLVTDTNILGTPSVVVSNTPNVSVTGVTTVDFATPQSVDINNIPAVTLDGAQDVNVANVPAITFSGTQDVNIASIDAGASLSTNATLVGTPAVTATITGTPTVDVGNFPATQNVNVSNVPAVTFSGAQPISIDSQAGPLAVESTLVGQSSNISVDIAAQSGSNLNVDVANFPATQAVSVSNVPAVTFSGTQDVNVANVPAVTFSGTQDVNITSIAPTASLDTNATIVGTPAVSATISGTPTVTIGNFPATQPVSIASLPDISFDGAQPVSISSSVPLTTNASIVNTPNVVATISGTPAVTATISGTPDVNIASQTSPLTTNSTIVGTPNVAVTNTPNVVATISGTPNVAVTNTPNVVATISGTPNVAVTNTPDVNIASQDAPLLVNQELPVSVRVARGDVAGAEFVCNFGRRVNEAAGVNDRDLWEGAATTYPAFSTAAAVFLEVLSTNANDTGTGAGTGARQVRLFLLDGAGVEVTVDAILNGTTATTIPGTYLRCNRAFVIDAGSNGSNQGIVRLRQVSATANIFAEIEIGYNQTTQSFFTVPAAKRLFITEIVASMARTNGSNGGAGLALRAREPGTNAFRTVSIFEVSNGSPFNLGTSSQYSLPFEPLTDLKVVLISVSDNATNVSVEWGGYLVAN